MLEAELLQSDETKDRNNAVASSDDDTDTSEDLQEECNEDQALVGLGPDKDPPTKSLPIVTAQSEMKGGRSIWIGQSLSLRNYLKNLF